MDKEPVPDHIEVVVDLTPEPFDDPRKPFRPVPREWKDKLETAVNLIDDLVAAYAFHDRRGDEDLTVDDIGYLVQNGHLTEDIMVERFRAGVRAWIKDMEG